MYDFVHFKVALYFDSFADEGLYPVPAERVTFFIDKDTEGSNLGDQSIDVQESSGIKPGFCQGGNLSQWGPKIESDADDRAWWALKALGFAVGLFCEPVSVAMGLIDLASAFAPNEGTDYEDAGWSASDISARCWWHCYGCDFDDANPVRQYALNTIDWLQDWNVEPSSYYGINVWARVELPLNNPFDVSYIDIDPISLKIEQSGGGGCPYVYTWNGQRYVMDNNLLPAAEISNGADVEDFYRLEQLLVPTYQGRRRSVYSLQIREFEQEHDYFDQVKLLAVDHSSDVNVAVTPHGEILTYSNPVPPVSAVDEAGSDVLSLLSSVDGDYYQGYNGSYVTITFASTDISNGAKLVIRDDWPPYFEKCPVYVQVLNATGEWDTIAVFHTRAKWATDIINMTGYLPDANGDLKVRLCFVSNDKIDYVGLDTTPQQDYKTRKAILIYAEHSEDGPVTFKLLTSDDKYAELVPGEQIQLTFLLPNNQNQERTFILYTEGHYNTIP